jgi:rubrerythrin
MTAEKARELLKKLSDDQMQHLKKINDAMNKIEAEDKYNFKRPTKIPDVKKTGGGAKKNKKK